MVKWQRILKLKAFYQTCRISVKIFRVLNSFVLHVASKKNVAVLANVYHWKGIEHGRFAHPLLDAPASDCDRFSMTFVRLQQAQIAADRPTPLRGIGPRDLNSCEYIRRSNVVDAFLTSHQRLKRRHCGLRLSADKHLARCQLDTAGKSALPFSSCAWHPTYERSFI